MGTERDDTYPREQRYTSPISDIPYMMSCFEDFKIRLEETGDIGKARNSFFSHVLLGYYDAMFDGLSRNTGNVVYRLSDSLPDVERQMIEIYPSSTGSLAIDGAQWDSLEDWRKEWERNNPFIPFFDFSPAIEGVELLEIVRVEDKTTTD